MMERRTLIKATFATGAALMLPGKPAKAEDDILHHVREIERLLKADMPSGSLKGFQFACRDGDVDQKTIWATTHLDNGNLCHMRPAVFDGWRETQLNLVGEV